MENEALIPAAETRRLCGGVSDMTFYRWLNMSRYAELNFPKPLVIARRRYWKKSEILEWIDSRGRAA